MFLPGKTDKPTLGQIGKIQGGEKTTVKYK